MALRLLAAGAAARGPGFALVAALAFPGTAVRADPPAPASADSSGPESTAKPVVIGLAYYGDALGTVSGGIEPGWSYEGRLGLLLDGDLERLLGWKGARFHVSIHQIHGDQPTPAHVGALALLSGIEAEPNTRLFNLWVEQELGPNTSLRLGQFTAGQEFAVSATAGLFVNSTFGWPNILAQDLPSGGPAYPIGALGARLSYIGPKGALLVAIFNGDPAGPGAGDPQQRDRNGLNSFHLSGGPFLIGETQFAVPRTSAKLRLGVWWLDREVPSQPLGPSIEPSSGSTGRHGDWGGYAVFDAVIAKRGTRSLSGFVRAAVAPGDRNLISAYVDGGVTLTGLFKNRPDDQLGFAAGLSKIGSAAREADASAIEMGLLSIQRDYEAVLEATYQSQVTPHWWLQPDLQLIVHPGGHVPFAASGVSQHAIRDALVLGVRNIVRF